MSNPLLEINDLKVHFPLKEGVFQRTTNVVKAVNGVNITINQGETLGIVGESGCGKSTLARAIVGLLTPTSGDILFEGKSMLQHNKKELRERRRDIQMVYQDPFTSLNPRMRAGDIIAAPLRAYRQTDHLKNRVLDLMNLVGLKTADYDKLPHQFSGGQRQRIGIARALALHPKLVILDEAVSALDVSVQAQVINLLEDLQKELGLTYLFISHDLSIIRHISDKIGVMYLGKIMEMSDSESLFMHPRHPYTNALLSSILLPYPTKGKQRERMVLKGELPSPSHPPSGCVFHTRCPFAKDDCKENIPSFRVDDKGSSDHKVSCFYPVEHKQAERIY